MQASPVAYLIGAHVHLEEADLAEERELVVELEVGGVGEAVLAAGRPFGGPQVPGQARAHHARPVHRVQVRHVRAVLRDLLDVARHEELVAAHERPRAVLDLRHGLRRPGGLLALRVVPHEDEAVRLQALPAADAGEVRHCKHATGRQSDGQSVSQSDSQSVTESLAIRNSRAKFICHIQLTDCIQALLLRVRYEIRPYLQKIDKHKFGIMKIYVPLAQIEMNYIKFGI